MKLLVDKTTIECTEVSGPTYFKSPSGQLLAVYPRDGGFEIGITGPFNDPDAPLLWHSVGEGGITNLVERNLENDLNYLKGIIETAQNELNILEGLPGTPEVTHAIKNKKNIVMSYTALLKP